LFAFYDPLGLIRIEMGFDIVDIGASLVDTCHYTIFDLEKMFSVAKTLTT
jgi:hypothetical protein